VTVDPKQSGAGHSVATLGMGWLRSPLVHFLAIGLVCFVAFADTREPASFTSAEVGNRALGKEIVFGPWQIATVLSEYERETGLTPTPDDERAILAKLADEEMLFREAMAKGLFAMDRSIALRLATKMAFLDEAGELADDRARVERAVALGLHTDDVVVRRILVQKMKLVSALQAGADEVGEQELLVWFQENAERFRQPATVDLEQLFFGRGPEAKIVAAGILEKLGSGALDAKEARAASRPLASPSSLRAAGRTEISKHFGDNFAEQALAADVNQWNGPIESAYGAHLFRVLERSQTKLPSLEAVRGAASAAIRGEKRKRAVEDKLIELRGLYTVRIERDAGAFNAS
jgi:hypothetical protein